MKNKGPQIDWLSCDELPVKNKDPRKDPRIVTLVDWLNKATEKELDWMGLLGSWYKWRFQDQLRHLYLSQTDFLAYCNNPGDMAEFLSGFTSVPRELSEDERREIQRKTQEHMKDWIDPSTGKLYVEPEEPVGPYLDGNTGIIHNAPALSERSRKKFAQILPVLVSLWQEGIRENKEPLLRQCPVCDTWFLPSRKTQRFCDTPPADRPINPRTGKPLRSCRILAYEKTPKYKDKNVRNVTKCRENKKLSSL